MNKIRKNNKTDFMKKDILDPGVNRGSKTEKFFSVAILFLIIIAIGAFAILRSDIGIDADLLRGQISPFSEENDQKEASNQEQEDEDINTEEEFAENNNNQDISLEDEETGQEEQIEELFAQEVLPIENVGYDELLVDGNYKMKASVGDGLTHLARRALRNHLEEFDASDLTAEHAVYIEDYVQKNLSHPTGWLQLDEVVEIPEDLINEAIQSSYNLTDYQLENLSQYTR